MNILLEIITPEGVTYKDEVQEAIVPTTTGEITILPNHINLVTEVAPGELIIKKNNKTYSMVITEGFLEVTKNHVSLLANYAVRAESISIAKAEEAKKRAERLIKEKTSDIDFRIAEGELRKALLELKIGLKHRKKPI